jgi:NAD(P)-dependent dehydrogenase (short-subunit alcohol dehydrogenase family)
MTVTANNTESGPRVIVTGAASGIGAATAEALRARGARVIGLDVAEGPDILPCDVRDQDAVDSAVAQAAERLGGLDALVNCAGIGDPQSAGRPPGEDALRVLDVNLLGPWRVTAAALPELRRARGRVINVASGLAHLTVPFAPAYCMSKRGLVSYSDALRLEHGDEISVTTLYPGYVRTAIHQRAQALGISLEGLVPAERVQDVAATIVRAVLGPPARDLAGTRRGAAGYALLRIVPRRLVDRAVGRRMRQAILRGNFDRSELAADLRARVREAA